MRIWVLGLSPLSGAYEEGIAGMLTIIKASLLGSALMLLESCSGYLSSYQTPCVEGHVCECVRYTTVNRSWLDCRDYGRVKSRAGGAGSCALNPCAESSCNAIAALRCRTNRSAFNGFASYQFAEVLVSKQGLRHH